MTIDFEKLHTSVGSDVLRHGTDEDLLSSYVGLLRLLHGDDVECSPEEFKKLMRANNEVVAFVTYEGRIIATAQASHNRTPGHHSVILANVVAEAGFAEENLERIAVARVLQEAEKDWGRDYTLYYYVATDPTDAHAALYRELGFSSFNEYRGHPLMIWQLNR